jgi:prophage regulatory protein
MRIDTQNVPSNTTNGSHGLPDAGFVRLSSIIAPQGPIPIGRSTWWAGVKSGRFPKPVKLGPRTTAWKVEDIRKLIETAE